MNAGPEHLCMTNDSNHRDNERQRFERFPGANGPEGEDTLELRAGLLGSGRNDWSDDCSAQMEYGSLSWVSQGEGMTGPSAAAFGRSKRGEPLRVTALSYDNRDDDNCYCDEASSNEINAVRSVSELPALRKLMRCERVREWVSIFRRTDPRYRILNFFNDVAHEGASDKLTMSSAGQRNFGPELASPLLRCFDRASVFTVWRPTSREAIRLMMTGRAVGKGLDIKGKSAKAGKLSGFIPFVQIHEDSHKQQIQTLPRGASMRLFFRSVLLRDCASLELSTVMLEMLDGYDASLAVLADGSASEKDREAAMGKFMWELERPAILLLNEYASSGFWGLEVPQRVFWEAYVIRKDITRESGSDYDTMRPSQPAFQDMNFAALRGQKKGPDIPRPVVWQFSDSDAMCPLNLLVAYEERGIVRPVVSDFDCFLVGTRRVAFSEPLPEDQVEFLRREVDHIEEILSEKSDACWTARWLETLKRNTCKLDMPPYGFGDPKSYAIMEMAVQRLSLDGSVRHGAECFNYFFPQELDEEFLVISDALTAQHKVPWRYMNVRQLQDFLMDRAKLGYTFPLNPKWVLCDPGWIELYNALLSSTNANVRDSMNIWFPADVRERIARIRKRHPRGFKLVLEHENETQIDRSSSPSPSYLPGGMLDHKQQDAEESDGTAAMDLAILELHRHKTLMRAKRKLRAVLTWTKMSRISTGEASTTAEGAYKATVDAPAAAVQVAKHSSEAYGGIKNNGTDVGAALSKTVVRTASVSTESKIVSARSPFENGGLSLGSGSDSGASAFARGPLGNFPLAFPRCVILGLRCAVPRTNKCIIMLGQGLPMEEILGQEAPHCSGSKSTDHPKKNLSRTHSYKAKDSLEKICVCEALVTYLRYFEERMRNSEASCLKVFFEWIRVNVFFLIASSSCRRVNSLCGKKKSRRNPQKGVYVFNAVI